MATNVVGNTIAGERQERGGAAGYVQRTGSSGGPGFRRELILKGLLDRLGQTQQRLQDGGPFDGRESDVPVGFGFAEDQNHPNDDSMGESDFGY